MNLEKLPIVETEMLIRKPAVDVFQAFADPALTTKFWFTKSSGPLIAGQKAKWTWEMYGASADVFVHEMIPQKKIVMDWGEEGKMTRLEWTFIAVQADQTVVAVKETGHKGTPDEVVARVLDSMGGFNLVLAAAKFYLEHHIQPLIILDRFIRP